MKKLKKNDTVVVLTGKDKGKKGEIIAINMKHSKIKVKGVNIVTCHVKPRKQGETGGLQKRESYIHMSNVLPYDSLSKKPVRLKKIKRK